MAPVHQISTILHVADIASQLSFGLSAYSRNEYVPSQVRDLAKTIAYFALVLQRSATLFRSRRSVCSIQAAETAQQIAKKGTRALDEIDDMLEMARDMPETEAESASASREYVEACFETTRVQFLQAHIECLDLNATLILQIAELGKRIELLDTVKDDDQRQNINDEMSQEELIAYDILFARQMQIKEVNKAWSAYDAAHSGLTNIEKRRMGLPKLSTIEDQLDNMFDSDEAMSSVSEHAILFLLGEWTYLDSDRNDRPDEQRQAIEDTDEEDSAYYAPEDEYNDRHGHNYNNDQHYYHDHGSDQSHERDDRIPARQVFDNDNRYETHHHRRDSYRSESDASSRHGRHGGGSHRRRRSSRSISDSEDNRDSRHNRHRKPSRDAERRDSNDNSNKVKADKKKDEKDEKKEEKKDGEKEDKDGKADDSKKGGLGEIPIESLVIGGLIDMARERFGKKDKTDDAAGEVPKAEAVEVPPAPVQSGRVPEIRSQLGTSSHPTASNNQHHSRTTNVAPSPNGSPHLRSSHLTPSGSPGRSASNDTGRSASHSQNRMSSAAQRYTPQSTIPQDHNRSSSMGPGYGMPIQNQSTAPTPQYATQYANIHRRSSSQLPPPPHDRYGPSRVDGIRSSSHNRVSSHDDGHKTSNNYHPASPHRPLYHDERLPSPNRPPLPQTAPYRHSARIPDNRTPPPHSAPHFAPDRSYYDRPPPRDVHSSHLPHGQDNRQYRQGYLSPDDLRGRRSSFSSERPELEPRSGRSSRSPTRRHEHDRLPSRENDRRRSLSRGRRPSSLERRSGKVSPRNSPRHSARPQSRPASRVRPSTYRPKPMPVRTRIKPPKARAASKLISSLASSRNLSKGLGILGKIRR